MKKGSKKIVNILKSFLFYLKLICFVILLIILLNFFIFFLSDEEHEHREISKKEIEKIYKELVIVGGE